MIWGAVTSAGVGPLCFIKSKANAAVYQEILEHFMLPSADKLYGDADFLFQQDFSTCPQCQTTSKCFADHDITVLDWPANMPDLNPIWNLWDIFKRKMRNSRSNNPDELKAQWCLSSATGWSLPCHTTLMLEFVLKEPRPSIECINEHTLKNLNFSVLQILFLIDLRKYSNILRYWFLTFISFKLKSSKLKQKNFWSVLLYM